MNPTTSTRDVDVWWASLSSASSALKPLVSDHEWHRSMRRKRPADQGQRLVAAVLLRLAVAERTGADPAAMPVERSCATCGADHGCPRVPDACVSVSHSGQLICVAVASVPLGVDVECDDLWRRAQRELVAVEAANPTDLGESPAEWTRREAWIKVRGCAQYHQAMPPVQHQLLELVAPLRGYSATLVVQGAEPEVRYRDGDSLIRRALDSADTH